MLLKQQIQNLKFYLTVKANNRDYEILSIF